MIEAYVIAVFEHGQHVGYWNEDDVIDECIEAMWYESHDAAAESLLDIPRRIDARIYRLTPSVDPTQRLDEAICTQALPSFLRTGDQK